MYGSMETQHYTMMLENEARERERERMRRKAFDSLASSRNVAKCLLRAMKRLLVKSFSYNDHA
jgi:hypothetical protein